jgi:hypothetical protein
MMLGTWRFSVAVEARLVIDQGLETSSFETTLDNGMSAAELSD